MLYFNLHFTSEILIISSVVGNNGRHFSTTVDVDFARGRSINVQVEKIMKKIILPLTALLLLSVASFAQTLTPADREKGVQYLDQTRDGVVAATKGLSEAQMKFKPAPDRWSVAETLEHIALAEDFLFQNVTEKIMKASAGPPGRNTAKIDAMVLAMIPDRSHKAQAPPPLVPTGRWTPAETLDHFLKSRAKTIEFVQSTPDLREHVADSPLGQPLDAYEWLLFIAAHSERHTKQILEVKSDPNFPKN
jgi:DinB superfamily